MGASTSHSSNSQSGGTGNQTETKYKKERTGNDTTSVDTKTDVKVETKK